MRVLFSCQPGLGHFHPMVGLARVLRAAGHDVVVATAASFCPQVERAGLSAVAVGLDWLESDVERAFPELVTDASSWDVMRGAWPGIFARTGARLIPDLVDALSGGSYDLVVSESLELAAPLAAEAAAVPRAVLGIAPWQPPLLAADRVSVAWDTARSALGLAPDPRLERLQPPLYLDTYPPSMRWARTGATGVHHAISPTEVELGDGPRPGWLDDLPDGATAYVTMGTVFNRVHGIFASICEALSGESVQAIVTVGANADPAVLGPGSDLRRIEHYVPQAAVLPRVDVVISHAGHGTTLGALRHGVPMLALPMTSDQRANAERLVAAGAGLMLEPRATPSRIRHAVRALLDDPLYRMNARRLGREIAAMPSPSTAVTLLRDLADQPAAPVAAAPAVYPG
jgi:UDP:flavonoid glycosyltransferase YjiC (YdhE family)